MAHELRQNRLTGQWVIYATGRSNRPKDFKTVAAAREVLPEHDPDCPFCPGSELLLPGIVMETMKAGQWQVRVVPNKFPMFDQHRDDSRDQRGMFLSMSGRGTHEVIIEHPRHDLDIPDFDTDEVYRVLDTYYWRYITLMAVHNAMSVTVFRNHGPMAGTSLLHPHSQLVVTPIVAREIRWREQLAQEYYDTWGRDLLGNLLRQELQEAHRIVDHNDSFVAFVPYAAEMPFEIWIVPRRQQADFADITDIEKRHLARILRDTLWRLREGLADPDYNYVIHSASRYRADEPHLRWYLQIRPRLITSAGFELGTGMRVNSMLPEDNAALLREISPKSDLP